MAAKLELSRFLVNGTPPTIYYIPEFVSPTEAAYLWKQVYSAPSPKWTQLSNRRLQNWGGLPHPKGMIQEPLPNWLGTYCDKVNQLGMFGKPPNHVLVNEYLPGQGIMPHEDGPLYLPMVATISLGSCTLLDYYTPVNSNQQDCSYDSRRMFSIVLEPRSLVLVTDHMYTNALHGITESTNDVISDTVINVDMCRDVKYGQCLERTTRVSLTIRHVPKVLKMKLKF